MADLRTELTWAAHNLIAHPLSEILHWIGRDDVAHWFHDVTIPPHEPGTGRG